MYLSFNLRVAQQCLVIFSFFGKCLNCYMSLSAVAYFGAYYRYLSHLLNDLCMVLYLCLFHSYKSTTNSSYFSQRHPNFHLQAFLVGKCCNNLVRRFLYIRFPLRCRFCSHYCCSFNYLPLLSVNSKLYHTLLQQYRCLVWKFFTPLSKSSA